MDENILNPDYEITVSIHKPIFHISAVAKMIGIHQQTLRSYEKQGVIRPARSDGNTRLYSVNEIERLRQMLTLVNDLGVNLVAAEIILRMREQITSLQNELDDAKQKIDQILNDQNMDPLKFLYTFNNVSMLEMNGKYNWKPKKQFNYEKLGKT